MPTSAIKEPYHTRPLRPGSRCIRLLDVQALSNFGDDSQPLEADLRIVDLDERPRYNGLSYVWGQKSSQPKIIRCGTTDIELSDNCYLALRHLRRRFETLTIWVDAICINQEDEEEKSDQIRLMRDIYSAAENVYIWLGEGSIATDRAMSRLPTTGFQEYYLARDRVHMTGRTHYVCDALWNYYLSRWIGRIIRFAFPTSSESFLGSIGFQFLYTTPDTYLG